MGVCGRFVGFEGGGHRLGGCCPRSAPVFCVVVGGARGLVSAPAERQRRWSRRVGAGVAHQPSVGPAAWRQSAWSSAISRRKRRLFSNHGWQRPGCLSGSLSGRADTTARTGRTQWRPRAYRSSGRANSQSAAPLDHRSQAAQTHKLPGFWAVCGSWRRKPRVFEQAAAWRGSLCVRAGCRKPQPTPPAPRRPEPGPAPPRLRHQRHPPGRDPRQRSALLPRNPHHAARTATTRARQTPSQHHYTRNEMT